MTGIFKVSALAWSLVCGSAADAQPVRYICQINTGGTNGWIAPDVVIVHVPGSKTAVVNDRLIMTVLKKPVTAQVVAGNDRRLTVKWELPAQKDTSGQYVPRFQYRASYYRNTGRMMLWAIPIGYENSFRGFGSCRVK